MRKILKKRFFERGAASVASDLLGKYLVRKMGRRSVAFLITETEAYSGLEDNASHASRGRTARTEPMFGPAGYFYVYLCYGMYWMLNIVTGPKDYPAAVLIRGVEGFDGPGKLTKHLKINKRLNALCASPAAGLWIEDRTKPRSAGSPKGNRFKIKKTPRIGVAYAGPVWAKKKWRFALDLDVTSPKKI